jgi:hypothetical protein
MSLVGEKSAHSFAICCESKACDTPPEASPSISTALTCNTNMADYGYEDASPDYGYGDGMGYGYGDEEAAPAPTLEPIVRPKRRCSVTKYSLATESPLHAADVISNYRAGSADDVSAEPTSQGSDLNGSEDGGNDHLSACTGGSMDFCIDTSDETGAAESSSPPDEAGGRNVPGRKKSGIGRLFAKRR